MKVIYPDKINSISASDEDSDYPVSNLYSKHTTDVWKSTGQYATLICQVNSGSNAFALFNTNAEIIGIQFLTVNGSTTPEIIWASGNDWFSEIQWGQIYIPSEANNGTMEASNIIWEDDARVFSNAQWDQNHETSIRANYLVNPLTVWINYGLQSIPIDLTLYLEAPVGEVVQVGAIRAGYAYSFNDIRPGVTESRTSTSIINDLSYGYIYINNAIQNTKNFKCKLDIARNSDFYTLLHNIIVQAKGEPLAWYLAESLSTEYWVVLGYIPSGGFSGSHLFPLDSEVSLSIVEAI